MNGSPIYIVVSVGVLAVVALLVFLQGKGRRANRLSSLASLAFGFVIAGIIFGEERVLGYSLLGIGVLLGILDMFNRSKSE